MTIRRALLSAFDKTGLLDFARILTRFGCEIISTGGTARALTEGGLSVTDVAMVTGVPEMMDGRVKTLHPGVHGGLLMRRDEPSHVAAAEAHGIVPIDLVYVDLYPFEAVVRRLDATDAERIEMIDIGGPAMLRSAAKNHEHVVVIADRADLAAVGGELLERGGGISPETRRRLAAAAFRRTSLYDAVIAGALAPSDPPEALVLAFRRAAELRYGENPHQRAALYLASRPEEPTVAHARVLAGREMSYNNFTDAQAALDVVRRLPGAAAAIVKHGNPCGVGVHPHDAVEAYERALSGDPEAAFGGILSVNRTLSMDLAVALARPERFFEVIVVPDADPAAVQHVAGAVRWGRNVRVLATGPVEGTPFDAGLRQLRWLPGGLLVQDRDVSEDAEWTVATRRAPTTAESADLRLAWEVVRHVSSNAIVLARDGRVVGVGAGQMSRVASVRIACERAGDRARGAVLASDAFFPFRDGVDAATAAGVVALIQPGGSVRDKESVEAADAGGAAMVFTGRRHFRH